MNRRSSVLRGGARAVTGLLVVGACGVAVALLGSAELPSTTREPLAITVDTTQNATRSLVCAGSFAELGADPDRPSAAIPVGAPTVAVAGEAAGRAELTRPEGGDGLPGVFSGPLVDPLAAAQIQSVHTEKLEGMAGSACAEPLNEQWLLGGSTSAGVSTTLSIGNPGSVPATVQISVFDESGAVDPVRSSGLLVPAGTQQTVPLSGFAPDRGRVAVRIESTGAPVVASLGVGQVEGITPFAVSSVTRQSAPSERQVLPGLANESDRKDGPSDAGEGDEFPVVVQVFAPGGESGTARLAAIDGAGKRVDLGSIEFVANAVGEARVASWPKGANALIVEADAPVLAAALGSATEDDAHDYEWFAPAPEIASATPVAVPMVTGGQLIVANPGTKDAEVTIASADGSGKPSKTTVPAGAAVVVKAPAQAVLTSTEPVHAGVRYLAGGAIAGYPVLAPDPRGGELTVHTR
ncbi:MAG: DUF5719 family protein, partial [Leucobacter sp.]